MTQEARKPLHFLLRAAAAAAAVGAALLLAGCKAELSASASLKDLEAEPAYQLARLSIEVPACTDAQTDLESSSVAELKSHVPAVFPKAQYLACKDAGFESHAEFTVPILIGRLVAPCAGTDVCLGIPADDPGAVVVAVGPEFRSGYQKLEKANYSKLEPVVKIALTNDSGKPADFIAPSLFINGKPCHLTQGTLQAGQLAELQLSDVGAQFVIAGGAATVMLLIPEER